MAMSTIINKLTLDGIHGTTKLRASQIIENGFKTPDTIGKCGKGIYFWEGHAPISQKIAKAWWSFCSQKKIYDDTSGFDAIFSHLILQEQYFLDGTTPYFLNNFDEVISDKEIPKENIPAFYDVFLLELEDKLRKKLNDDKFKFKVVRINIPVPRSEARPIHLENISGNTFPSLIVKDDLECVVNVLYSYTNMSEESGV